MSQPKEIPLNGAYYGPSIPPQEPYRRRSGGCCLISTLFKVIISFIVVLGIAALVLWLVLRPNHIKVHVENASLTQFNLTDNRVLQYNLSLAMSVRNPNKRIGIYYDRLEATALYDGERFSYIPLPTFYQGHKNTTMLYPVFTGANFIDLSSSEVVDFNEATGSGVFYVDVKIYARIRFKVGSVKTHRVKPEIKCELRIPLATNGSTDGSFTRTKCDVDF
ncbi:NDR1/HIN1-like protein 10 [Tasmannia lanceolata]|uniref:NDR1/HIN1-like protein 10 n=1 Tax=Tasmannia lanceolata TaxID=3420 RepID=UPI0040639E95